MAKFFICISGWVVTEMCKELSMSPVLAQIYCYSNSFTVWLSFLGKHDTLINTLSQLSIKVLFSISFCDSCCLVTRMRNKVVYCELKIQISINILNQLWRWIIFLRKDYCLGFYLTVLGENLCAHMPPKNDTVLLKFTWKESLMTLSRFLIQ